MKRISLGLFSGWFLVAGCAGEPTLQTEAPAPYKAVLVFSWLESARGEEGPVQGDALAESPPASGPVSLPAQAADPEARARDAGRRRGVETEILASLEKRRVFSALVAAEPGNMEAVAHDQKADLIVFLSLGDIAMRESKTQVETGSAILEGFLWIGTGVGSWWIPDLEFSTRSDVQVRCKRTKNVDASVGWIPEGAAALQAPVDWSQKEQISSGKYSLSFWDRAKPWSSPGAYLLSILIPPVLVPNYDHGEAQKALNAAALEDIQRDLARYLKGGYLGSCGAPLSFRMKEPANGSTVARDKVKLKYLYSVEAGFDELRDKPLRALYVSVKRGDRTDFENRRAFVGDEIASINEKIRGKNPIDTEVDGLGPGTNLVRFVALTDAGAETITNTVAFQRK